MTGPLPRLIRVLVVRGVRPAVAEDVLGDLEARWQASGSRWRGHAAVWPLALSVWWHGRRDVRERSRTTRGRWWPSLADVGRASRRLGRERAVTVVAVASLAVGIAVNATVFSLVQTVEFPSFIYPDASRIVVLESRQEARDLLGLPVSWPDGHDVRQSIHSLEPPALAADQDSVLRVGGNRRVVGRRVESGFFSVLDVPAAIGRTLGPADVPGTIVLGDRLWRDGFGRDPTIVGRLVDLDGGTVTVVGVMPPAFDPDADFWVPLEASSDTARDNRIYTAVARLAPHATLGEAARDLTALSARLAADHLDTNAHWVLYPTPLADLHGRDSRRAFLLLQGAVGILLLIVCANVANILLSRGADRQREMALQLALGSTRARLVGELLLESTILAGVGGALGTGLAVWGIRLARLIGGFPAVLDPSMNWTVLFFMAGLSATTGIVCGLVPAVRASGVALDAALRAADSRTMTGPQGRLGGLLVVLQIAGALTLVVCGALMTETLANRARVDLGFNPHGVVRGDVAMVGDRYNSPDALRQSVTTVLEHLQASPGLLAAGATTFALPTAPGGQRRFTIPGEAGALAVPGSVEAVTPGYFDAIGLNLVGGRPFHSSDGPGAAPVAVVNAVLAARLWAERSPVGTRLRLGEPPDSPVVTVVGVVSSLRRSPMHDVVIARVYVPFAQYPGGALTVVARTAGPMGTATRALETAVHQADSRLVVDGLRSVDDDLARFVAPVRLTTQLLVGFGLVSLLLAVLGVFGSMRYRVTARQRELAVRAALGATSQDLRWLVMRSGTTILLVGLVLGSGLALVAARALRSVLFGIDPADPVTLVGAASVLAVTSLAACLGPARRASRADPVVLLRGN